MYGYLSGSEEVSPPPRPLRTVRAPFNAHGASKPGWSMYHAFLWRNVYCSRFLVRYPPDVGLLLG